MKNLSRIELATVRRIAKIVKPSVVKAAKLTEKIEAMKEEVDMLIRSTEDFERPIKEMTGGYTSTEFLDALEKGIDLPDNKYIEELKATGAEFSKPNTMENDEVFYSDRFREDDKVESFNEREEDFDSFESNEI